MDPNQYHALLKADRSAAIGAASARAAAELNDLLTHIMLAAGTTPAVEQACVAAREITRRLAWLGQPDGGVAAAAAVALHPGEVLASAVRAAAVEQLAEVTVAADPNAAMVWGNREELVQAFRALVRNAAEAMSPAPRNPQVQLQAKNVTLTDGELEGLPGGDYIEFEVRDNGCGIAEESLQQIWQPLFTTKKHAAGVGLPMVLAVIRRHGGQVAVDSAPGEGSVFTVYLPVAPVAPSASGELSAEPPPRTRFRSGRVLVLDADEQFRSSIAAMLQRLDYTSDAAREPGEALTWYRRYLDIGRPYDAVLLDAAVPSAAATVAELKGLDPDVRTVAMASIPADQLRAAAESAGFTAYLAKPFRASELGEVLQTAAGR